MIDWQARPQALPQPHLPAHVCPWQRRARCSQVRSKVLRYQQHVMPVRSNLTAAMASGTTTQTQISLAMPNRRTSAGPSWQACQSEAGRRPINWSSTATSVQISEVVDRYEHTVAKATAAGVGSAEWKRAAKYARIGNPTCHPAVMSSGGPHCARHS